MKKLIVNCLILIPGAFKIVLHQCKKENLYIKRLKKRVDPCSISTIFQKGFWPIIPLLCGICHSLFFTSGYLPEDKFLEAEQWKIGQDHTVRVYQNHIAADQANFVSYHEGK